MDDPQAYLILTPDLSARRPKGGRVLKAIEHHVPRPESLGPHREVGDGRPVEGRHREGLAHQGLPLACEVAEGVRATQT